MHVIYYSITLLLILIIVLEVIIANLRSKLSIVQKQKNPIDIGSCRTIGNREIQGDFLDTCTTESGTMAVLADGNGRGYGGRIASKTAVDTCMNIFQEYNAFQNPNYYFRKAFHACNREILKAVGHEYRGTASAACIMVQNGSLFYAVVGNVQVAVYRKGALVPVSTGHTVSALVEQRFQEEKISRQDAIKMLENQRLYNYLGKDGFQEMEIFDTPVRLVSGDIILLMSDGVYELLGERELEAVLMKDSSCQSKAFELIEQINQLVVQDEDKDNASIVLLGIGKGALK